MLYIMRHGRTDWNDMHKLQGRTDIPLNEAGRAMASEASEKYRDINIDICFCSPLKRAKETAEIFLKDRGIEIITDDRLKEMSFGEFEGVVEYFEREDLPIRDLFKNPENYVATRGAESFEELFERTGNFLNEVVFPLVKEGKDVLIVGHGAMNLSIINRINNIPLKRYWETGIENCKIYQLQCL